MLCQSKSNGQRNEEKTVKIEVKRDVDELQNDLEMGKQLVRKVIITPLEETMEKKLAI